MSDIGNRADLGPGVSQLPVDWYFDEKLFELEKQLIFEVGPYQSPMEDGMQHFHEFYRRILGPHL